MGRNELAAVVSTIKVIVYCLACWLLLNWIESAVSREMAWLAGGGIIFVSVGYLLIISRK